MTILLGQTLTPNLRPDANGQTLTPNLQPDADSTRTNPDSTTLTRD